MGKVWEVFSYELLSWWDMQRFSASAFFYIGTYLQHNQVALAAALDKKGAGRDTKVSAGTFDAKAGKLLAEIRKRCEEVGLTISTKFLDEFIDLSKREHTVGDLIDAHAKLESIIRLEMQDKLFMYIPSERAKFYDQPEGFGKEVNAKFPRIQFDMVEAGNCLAAGRSTACVFHLMRIMESGVQQLGNKLGVPLVHETVWQVILDQINKAIKALPTKDTVTVEMSQAAANLYAVKLAWRNEVMHPKETYTSEEAENILGQVRLFMQQLARIV